MVKYECYLLKGIPHNSALRSETPSRLHFLSILHKTIISVLRKGTKAQWLILKEGSCQPSLNITGLNQ